MTETQEITADDMLEVRDIIARFEELDTDERDEEDNEEFEAIDGLLKELEGRGGDEQWRGAWYPIQMIADSYFQDYAEELADDMGVIDRNAAWPCNCIDWERAAQELQADYAPVSFMGQTYWFR